MLDGFTGISFPFRIGNKGGVVISSTDRFDSSHIEESIIQILRTQLKERVMEMEFGTNLDLYLFEPNESATHNLIKYEIVESLNKHEPRISVDIDDITLYQKETKTGESVVCANIEYEVIQFSSKQAVDVILGEV